MQEGGVAMKSLKISFLLLVLGLLVITLAGCKNQAPVAALGAIPTQGEAPLQVTFDASGSEDSDGEIVDYFLDFGDGQTTHVNGTATAAHTYTTTGTYWAQLTVTDNEGTTNTVKVKIQVTAPHQSNLPPEAHLTATPSQGDVPLKVTFDISGSSDTDGSVVSFQLNFGDGHSTNGSDMSTLIHHTYAATGTYMAQVVVTDNEGANGTASIQITVSSLPAGDSTPPSFSNEAPADGITANSGPISVEIRDDGSGVDANSITMTIAGKEYTASDPGVSWDGSVFSVTKQAAQAQLVDGQTIDVTVEASDMAGNTASFSWSFVWSESSTPPPPPPPG